jgi:hypothetical protein
MKKIILLLTIIISFSSYSQGNKVVIANNNDGMKLIVDGKDFIINGMKYPVKSIPRYMLIDPGGNLIDDNAPRPSSKEIKDIFNKIK